MSRFQDVVIVLLLWEVIFSLPQKQGFQVTFKNQHKNHVGLYHHRPETSFVLTMIKRKRVGKLSLESYAHLNISLFFFTEFLFKVDLPIQKG